MRAAIRSGKLKAQILGRGYKIKRGDLDRYIESL
jgi:excisionase family DNA binding protein